MLFQKIKVYFARKNETIPSSMQSSFLSRLSDLLKEGYTFHEAVSMLIPFHVKEAELVIQRIKEIQKNGLNVTDVFRVLGFPNRLLLPINLAMIHGQLQETVAVLGVNADLYERAKKRLNNLLMYPLFLFIVIFLLFTIFRIYFLPNMESLLGTRASLESESSIAWTTVLLHLPNTFLVVALVVAVLLFVFLFILNKTPVETQLNFYRKIPFINSWHRLLLTRVFSREMGGLIESGMSLQQSFDALITQEEHKSLQFMAEQMKDKIVHGESFSKAVLLLDYFNGDFHHFVIHGENSGYLGRELTLYSEFLSDSIETKLSRYLSVIQPILFLLLAVFIIGAYLAILLPIYEMINIV
ncbi:competence type IV pilus assembly protein ComGB [Bacillus sp. FJAT-22090]|uniref:competence type IV pilus assembly protein ComGB n=1 Tax=Bacillus sp. FJAT-22090 TaxID=1581038 RepID=UPI0011A9141B|nr:competence type IV pilus assembly protein ComGB [Bacillus sp. FJAT-22090]